MRNKIGILLMEDESGEISVQLFSEPDNLTESFKELHGSAGDNVSRATLLNLDYGASEANVRVKDLPVVDPPKDEQPDGYRLGTGPIWIEKEEGDGNEKAKG